MDDAGSVSHSKARNRVSYGSYEVRPRRMVCFQLIQAGSAHAGAEGSPEVGSVPPRFCESLDSYADDESCSLRLRRIARSGTLC